MSNGIRNVIRKKLAETLRDTSPAKLSEISSNLQVKYEPNNFKFFLPLKTKNYDIQEEAANISVNCGDDFPEVCFESEHRPQICFQFSRDAIIKNILENNAEDISPPSVLPDGKKIIVEFSSPNIAKPFHVGHLRSTIIGNYVANLHNFLNNDTRKINYLGDWGTQFGYVHLGMDLLKIDEDSMKSDPLTKLYEAYVYANKVSEDDPETAREAREIFDRLEKGDKEVSKKWQSLKNITTEELTKTYNRLGVSFDEYHWESMYGSKKIGPIIERLEKLKLLNFDVENRRVIAVNENRNVPIIKSDGSTLYLTRDIAAAIDRYEKYNFDRMYYVVDNAQNDHFTNLVTILGRMELSFAERIRHVKFGKIRGMSTRRGTAIFLSDFLNEARDVMREKQSKSLTTKVSLELDHESSDILGISAVIIHDLKQKRQRDYEFNWNVACDIKGETGVKLQYTHCRLISLEENSGIELPNECDPSLLRESIINDLVMKIIQFDEAIISSYRTLEPCQLAKYLFDLSHIVNKTIKEVRVKGEPKDIGSQRLLLYRVARNVLARGMKLLGLRPLEKM